MRYLRVKRDGNHAEIVQALKDAGRCVLDLAEVGGGCPDLLVSWSGHMLLMEVKDPGGRNRLEQSQIKFHAAWKGPPVVTVRSKAEALAATGVR